VRVRRGDRRALRPPGPVSRLSSLHLLASWRRLSSWRRLGPEYLLGLAVTWPVSLLWRRVWSGQEHLPAGGVVLAANHLSVLDPVAVAHHLLRDLDRAPRFLVKSELFRGSGLVARVLCGAGQIPVERDTAEASKALDAAVAALGRGETVVIYPEGTVTRDPRHWPMAARTGVARLALQSGAPVLPLAQWGTHEALRTVLRPFPRRTAAFRIGPPVDLSAFAGRPLTAEVLRDATDAVMDALTAEVAVLRAESAPAVRFDPRAGAGRRNARTPAPAHAPADARRTA
jgi:1-acyl-sn-glycerol-3-phosphate acyltransferase